MFYVILIALISHNLSSNPNNNLSSNLIPIALSKPSRLNGFTATSLGRVRPPFRGASSPPCTFSIFLMIDGAVASLPVRGSPYSSQWRWHPNGYFSRVGVPELWTPISPDCRVRLQQGLKKSFSSRRELSNAMSHSQIGHREEVYSRLLVVGSQTASLTPGPSFGHNLCFGCPNEKCEPILDIYVLRAFEWYQERNNPLRFDPSTRPLKFRESTGTPSPKMGVALGVWVFTPSHFLALP
jgi:hypothetical protein